MGSRLRQRVTWATLAFGGALGVPHVSWQSAASVLLVLGVLLALSLSRAPQRP